MSLSVSVMLWLTFVTCIVMFIPHSTGLNRESRGLESATKKVSLASTDTVKLASLDVGLFISLEEMENTVESARAAAGLQDVSESEPDIAPPREQSNSPNTNHVSTTAADENFFQVPNEVTEWEPISLEGTTQQLEYLSRVIAPCTITNYFCWDPVMVKISVGMLYSTLLMMVVFTVTRGAGSPPNSKPDHLQPSAFTTA